MSATAEPPGDDAGRPFEASHEQVIRVERGGAAYVVLHGDMHIRNGHPVYRFERFPLESRQVDLARARQQPSRLLAAESRVVPFAGRAEELARLAAWRDDPAPGVSVLLLHGPGGQGKTRLAAQFAVDSATHGWTVWAGHHVSDPTAELVAAPGDTGEQLLLVVEYAERWPVGDLQLLLQNPLLRRPLRARVLLVSRPAEVWWPALRHRLGKAGIGVAATIALTSLAPTADDRREVFDQARARFAAVFEAPVETAVATPDLTGDGFELVLTVHMAALVSVDAHVRGKAPPVDPAGLSAYLLDREHDYWQSMYDHGQDTTPPQAIARTVYTATLTRPLPPAQARAVLDRLGIAPLEQADGVLADHAACYPPSDPILVLEPLYPDRLGEDFIALLTPGHIGAEYGPDRWADSAPSLLLGVFERPTGPPVWARPALTVLIETGHRWAHVAEHLFSLLRPRPELALAAGGAALARLAAIPQAPIDVLEGVEAHFPAGRHVDLDFGMAAVTERVTRHRLATGADEVRSAQLYHGLGRRLINAGLYERAAEATTNAVRIRRHLSATEPDRHEPDLAMSLTNLGVALQDLGRLVQAEQTLAEATAIRRRRASTDPSGERDLAMALTNHSATLILLSRGADALPLAEEAVRIRRHMADQDPVRYEPDLAASLINLGASLASQGRRTEAMTHARDAVVILRRLADANPGTHAADLAGALVNLAVDQSDLGHHHNALAHLDEAVTVYRRLVTVNRDAFEPDLALALDNLCNALLAVGSPEQALATATEAVQISRRLVASNPASYQHRLARSLGKLAVALAELGRAEEALGIGTEALTITQTLAAANPVRHQPDLAELLNNLGTILLEEEHLRPAVAVFELAVRILRPLAHHRPALFEPDLARSLNSLGQAMPGRQRRSALAVTEEAVEIYRRLAATDPVGHGAGLAQALTNLGQMLRGRRHRPRALAATAEAVKICQGLAETTAGNLDVDLARSLSAFAQVRLAARTELAEALIAMNAATEICERLAAQRPATFGTYPALAYRATADLLDLLHRKGDARALRQLAVERHDR